GSPAGKLVFRHGRCFLARRPLEDIPQANFLSCLDCARRRLLSILSTVQSTSRSASSAISRKIAAFALSGSTRASWRYRAARARFFGSIGGTYETACEATAPNRVGRRGRPTSRGGCLPVGVYWGAIFSGSRRLTLKHPVWFPG